MQEALTTPATQTRCARTSTGSPTFPRRKGGTGGWSWGLVVREAAKHLQDHPEIAQGVEVGDVNPAVLTSEHQAVLALCPRNGLVEVRGGDGDVVHALALRGEEAGIDAVLVERLDKLPHPPADHGDGDAVGALDWLSVLAVVVRGTEVYPVEPPRADPVVVLVPPYRRLQIAHDDPQLHGLGEGRLAGGHVGPVLGRFFKFRHPLLLVLWFRVT